MGLADILTGMMHGPRGQRQPTSGGSGGGGMSPIMIALLGLLAYKASKGRGSQGPTRGATERPAGPGGTVSAGTPGGRAWRYPRRTAGRKARWRTLWRQAQRRPE
jgi:hypothetical protein